MTEPQRGRTWLKRAASVIKAAVEERVSEGVSRVTLDPAYIIQLCEEVDGLILATELEEVMKAPSPPSGMENPNATVNTSDSAREKAGYVPGYAESMQVGEQLLRVPDSRPAEGDDRSVHLRGVGVIWSVGEYFGKRFSLLCLKCAYDVIGASALHVWSLSSFGSGSLHVPAQALGQQVPMCQGCCALLNQGGE